MAFQNNLRELTKLIYRLKRQYGLTIEYLRPNAQTHNVETGEITRTYTQYTIKRAILLPTNMDRHFVYDLTLIAANNNFVGGGLFDRNQRIILIDAKDFPKDFIPNIDDHIEFDGERYEMVEVHHFERRKAYLLRVQSITNSDTVT